MVARKWVGRQGEGQEVVVALEVEVPRVEMEWVLVVRRLVEVAWRFDEEASEWLVEEGMHLHLELKLELELDNHKPWEHHTCQQQQQQELSWEWVDRCAHIEPKKDCSMIEVVVDVQVDAEAEAGPGAGVEG